MKPRSIWLAVGAGVVIANAVCLFLFVFCVFGDVSSPPKGATVNFGRFYAEEGSRIKVEGGEFKLDGKGGLRYSSISPTFLGVHVGLVASLIVVCGLCLLRRSIEGDAAEPSDNT